RGSLPLLWVFFAAARNLPPICSISSRFLSIGGTPSYKLNTFGAIIPNVYRQWYVAMIQSACELANQSLTKPGSREYTYLSRGGRRVSAACHAVFNREGFVCNASAGTK